jgi:hypothetical protein
VGWYFRLFVRSLAEELKVEGNQFEQIPTLSRDTVSDQREPDAGGVRVAKTPTERLGQFANATSIVNSFAADYIVTCPETIVVGAMELPAGFTDYGKKGLHFESLDIQLTAQGSQITCHYGNGQLPSVDW